MKIFLDSIKTPHNPLDWKIFQSELDFLSFLATEDPRKITLISFGEGFLCVARYIRTVVQHTIPYEFHIKESLGFDVRVTRNTNDYFVDHNDDLRKDENGEYPEYKRAEETTRYSNNANDYVRRVNLYLSPKSIDEFGFWSPEFKTKIFNSINERNNYYVEQQRLRGISKSKINKTNRHKVTEANIIALVSRLLDSKVKT